MTLLFSSENGGFYGLYFILGLAMKINVTFGPQKVLSWNLKEVCSCLLLTFISLNGTIIYDTEIMDVKRQVS
jgi:hypothetical protein